MDSSLLQNNMHSRKISHIHTPRSCSSSCGLLLVLKMTATFLGQAANNQGHSTGHSPQNCGHVPPCLNLTLPRPALVELALKLPWANAATVAFVESIFSAGLELPCVWQAGAFPLTHIPASCYPLGL